MDVSNRIITNPAYSSAYATLDATRRQDDQAEPFNLSYVWDFLSILSTTSKHFHVSALRQSPYQRPPANFTPPTEKVGANDVKVAWDK